MPRFLAQFFGRQPMPAHTRREHSELTIVIKKATGEIVQTISWRSPSATF